MNFHKMISLPPNWSWVKLGEVSKRIHYGFTASAKNKDVGPKLLRITDIQEGKVDWNEVPYCTIPSNDIHKYLLSENDIVFARTGATVGKSFLIKGKIPPSVFASYLIRLQLSDKTLPKFIYLFFQSNHYWSQIKSSSAGIGQPNVNAQKLSNLDIPLPPLHEQKKIVEKIEELFSGLDNGVTSLKKAKEQIRLYRQSVLACAFSGKLLTPSAQRQAQNEMLKAAEPKVDYSNQLPDGWKWVKLGDVTNNFDGKRIPLSKEVRSKRKGEYRYYGATEIIDHIDEYIFEGTYLLIGEDGANLVSRSRPLSFIVEGKFWVNNHAHVLQTKDELKIKYLDYYFNSITLEPYVTGSAQPKLNQMNLNKIPVPLAPLKQQTQIVEEIEKRFSEADNLEKAIDDSLVKSETLRQSILKQAFEGRLV